MKIHFSNLKSIINNLRLIKFQFMSFLLIASGALFNSCGDPVPTDYVEDYIIEGYMLVGDPIQNIRIMRTLPISDSFKLENSLIKDANVIIKANDGKSYPLQFRNEKGREGYFYTDSTELVKPKTYYKLEVNLSNGKFMSGETTTPDTFAWKSTVKDTIYYPKDTINLPFVDSLVIHWEPEPNSTYYLLMVKCLDTLEYGKYLTPVIDEKNRRIWKPWADEDRYYFDQTNYTFIPATSVPVVWGIFKWYGKHEIKIFAPDYNMFNWYKNYMIKGSFDPINSSINGGKGVFGSASYIHSEFFLVKNQP
jgi:hypothetical protein